MTTALDNTGYQAEYEDKYTTKWQTGFFRDITKN